MAHSPNYVVGHELDQNMMIYISHCTLNGLTYKLRTGHTDARLSSEISKNRSMLSTPPNTACSGRWGVCAFSGIFLHLSFFRSDGVPPSAPAPLTQTVRPSNRHRQ